VQGAPDGGACDAQRDHTYEQVHVVVALRITRRKPCHFQWQRRGGFSLAFSQSSVQVLKLVSRKRAKESAFLRKIKAVPLDEVWPSELRF